MTRVSAVTVRFFSKSETHREFSNCAPFPIDLDEMCRPTVEHYYRAQKFADTELQQKIHKMPKPAAVKAIVDKCRAKARPDWSEAKDVAMERAVRRNFDFTPSFGRFCSRPAMKSSPKPRLPTVTGASDARAPARTGSASCSCAFAPS